MFFKFHKNFKKQYKLLSLDQKIKVEEALSKFLNNPYDLTLKNHKLVGALIGKRAISCAFDLRIVYEEVAGHAVVLFLKVGTHNQVYK